MRDRVLLGAVVLMPLMASPGCALIVNGRTQSVKVRSTPSQAEVLVAGEARCTTPCSVQIARGDPAPLTVRKEGYSQASVDFETRLAFGSAIIGNLFSFSLLGMLIDFASGAAYNLKPEEVTAALSPLGPAEARQPAPAPRAQAAAAGPAPPSGEDVVDRAALAGFVLRKLAVPTLGGPNIEAAIVDILSEELTAEAARSPGVSVLGASDITAMLGFEKQKDLLGCSDNISCVAEIGGALGADAILVGSLGRLGETYVLSLKLIDTLGARVLVRTSDRHRGQLDDLADVVRRAVRRALDHVRPAGRG